MCTHTHTHTYHDGLHNMSAYSGIHGWLFHATILLLARVADRSSGVGRHSEGVIVCVSCRIRQRFCGWRNKISVSVSVTKLYLQHTCTHTHTYIDIHTYIHTHHTEHWLVSFIAPCIQVARPQESTTEAKPFPQAHAGMPHPSEAVGGLYSHT
jgi:hypothetical protein